MILEGLIQFGQQIIVFKNMVASPKKDSSLLIVLSVNLGLNQLAWKNTKKRRTLSVSKSRGFSEPLR